MKTLTAILVAAVCAGACARDLDGTSRDSGTSPDATSPEPDPTTIRFELRNDGTVPVHVFESCIVDFKITSLADPNAPLTPVAGCVCTCDQAPRCPTCGQCFVGTHEIAVGGQFTAYWLTASMTTETRGNVGCQRLHTLPAGAYRIDLPVYASEADATAKVSARIVTQTFTLPPPSDLITIPVAAPAASP